METSKLSFHHFLIKCAVIAAAAILLIPIAFLSITGCCARFEDRYVAALALKYEVLQTTQSPKIIIVGGSSAGFGIDSALLEEKTGYNVVNMGLHAGFGLLFNTEIAKDFIQEGDIVLLGYEYNLHEDAFEKLGDVNLIMQGIDNHLEIYRAIPFKNIPEILGNLFDFSVLKLIPGPAATGIYSRSSFDDNGNMVLPRKTCLQDYEQRKEAYGEVSGDRLKVTASNLEYLKNLKVLIEKKNASVYFIAPPLLGAAFTGHRAELTDFANFLEQETGIPYISDPLDYLFDKRYLFDTIYHCNEAGELKRTELLANDLNQVIEK